MKAAALALASVAFLVLVPTTGAEHAFSHRVVVTGRVIDSEGRPVPGVDVEADFHGLDVGGACFDARPPRTGPQGDFVVCRHAHEFSAPVPVTVRVAGEVVEARLDPALRRVDVEVQTMGPAPARDITGERLFARTLRAEGRVTQLVAVAAPVEGVLVPALPLGGSGVRVRLEAGDAVLGEANLTLNEQGDYAIDLDVADVPEGAVLRVDAAGASWVRDVSLPWRRAFTHLVVAAPETDLDDRPGTRTPTPVPVALAALALGLAALGLRKR